MKDLKYKMRAECQYDLGRFLQAIQVSTITAIQSSKSPDMEVEFASRMSLEAIIKLLGEIADGHIMAETVAFESQYSGIRAPPLNTT